MVHKKNYQKHYLFFVLSLVLWSFITISCVDEKVTTVPVERSLTESVYSSVTVQPDSLYKVFASVGGILDKNLVEEGDKILKRDPLIQIINNTPQLNVLSAKLSLDLARENYNGNAAILNGIKDEIVAATLQFQNDSLNYFRQKSLWEQKIGSKVLFDTKKLNYQLSLNNLQLLRRKYDRTKNELYTTVRKAENNYKTSLIATKDFTVNSAVNGKVYALYKNPGEIINTLEPLAAVGSDALFIIEMLVDEVDIVSISLNQKVVIVLDAYNGKIFSGKVSKIYPQKDERNQTFKVEALFDNAPDVLYPGLSGEANIIIAKKEKVLTIPKEYLIDENKVKTDEGLVNITTGLQSLEFVEVLSGITEKTIIYKPE